MARVEAVLGAHPELDVRRLDRRRWLAILPGEIRQKIPVAIEVGRRDCTLSSFLLRGPRRDAAALHRVLLRKNLATARVRFCLDEDDDVLLVARLPLAAVGETELEEVLGELYAVSEGAFEALVHIGYPGVFPPLRRGTAAPPPADKPGAEPAHPGGGGVPGILCKRV